MNSKLFYDNHLNFALRSLLEYEISPGIRCKYDLIVKNINLKKKYISGLDLGCSGDSFLFYLKNVKRKSFLDLSDIPLHQYIPKFRSNINNQINYKTLHPLCADMSSLPYNNESFDILCCLDTLEHIKNDQSAIDEISRVLKKNGICIITVPHRSDYYTLQDKLIGHYRRYEIKQLIELFEINRLRCLKCFNVYGKLMKFAFLQTLNPRKVEQKLIILRQNYQSKPFFKYLWKVITKILSILMKIDAKYHKVEKGMNLGFIFKKK
jgi:SAM-dependent methyltransferase